GPRVTTPLGRHCGPVAYSSVPILAPVRGLTVTAPRPGSLRWTWDALSPAPFGYRLYDQAAKDGPRRLMVNTITNAYEAPAAPGPLLFFAAVAVDDQGNEGPF